MLINNTLTEFRMKVFDKLLKYDYYLNHQLDRYFRSSQEERFDS